MPINGQTDKKYEIHIQNGILISHEKGKDPHICNSMDGSWARYTKRDKSGRENTERYDLHVEFKKVKSIKNRVKWWLPRDEGGI